jgi:ABC-2 type transport system permease protein
MNITVMKTLLRRETWEHRGLIWAPLITAAVIVLTALLSTSFTGSVQINIDGKEREIFAALATDLSHQRQLFAVWLGALVIPQMIVAMIVLVFYVLDSLYNERKDRSILFWKSMPVSDAETVGSKLATALLLVPLWVWLVSLIASLVVFAIVSVKLAGTPLEPLATFHLGTWFALQLTMLQNVLVAALWYAPVAVYLLLTSVYAKRSPFLWAVLPPVLLVIFEEMAFNTSMIAGFIANRLFGFFRELDLHISSEDGDTSASAIEEIARSYDQLGTLDMLLKPDLWLGVAFAVVGFFVIVRLRRWRDDA